LPIRFDPKHAERGGGDEGAAENSRVRLKGQMIRWPIPCRMSIRDSRVDAA
jgi:hypothetical protein